MHYSATFIQDLQEEILNFRYMVRLGEWNTDTTQDCITVQTRKVCSPNPVDVRVERAIAHESYDSNDDNRYNDIGIIKVAKDITYSSKLFP